MEQLISATALAFTIWWIVGTLVYWRMHTRVQKTWKWMLVYGPVVFLIMDFLPLWALVTFGVHIIYRDEVYIARCTRNAFYQGCKHKTQLN